MGLGGVESRFSRVTTLSSCFCSSIETYTPRYIAINTPGTLHLVIASSCAVAMDFSCPNPIHGTLPFVGES